MTSESLDISEELKVEDKKMTVKFAKAPVKVVKKSNNLLKRYKTINSNKLNKNFKKKILGVNSKLISKNPFGSLHTEVKKERKKVRIQKNMNALRR